MLEADGPSQRKSVVKTKSALETVFLSPFRPGAPHIVELGPVRIEKTGPHPVPPLSNRVEVARRPSRKQHSRDIRITHCAHFGPPSIAGQLSDATDRHKLRPSAEGSILPRLISHQVLVWAYPP